MCCTKIAVHFLARTSSLFHAWQVTKLTNALRHVKIHDGDTTLAERQPENRALNSPFSTGKE
uniref:Uncharacterized protein n=1 Tax=Anguilla anguilla TaxID=7936 RepID=A0A0E9XTM5_ANGAN